MKLLKFIDGQDVYDDFNSAYKRHKKGYIILGPPGIGKTTFVNSQKGSKKDWIDTDTLFGSKSLNVNWNNNKTTEDERLAYLRADYMLEQSKIYGYRIIGSLYWDYKADAVVIPPFSEHKKYLKLREDLDIGKVREIRVNLLINATKNKIPVFTSIDEAVKSLEEFDHS